MKYFKLFVFTLLAVMLFPKLALAAGSVTVTEESLTFAKGGSATFEVRANKAAGKFSVAVNDEDVDLTLTASDPEDCVDNSFCFIDNNSIVVTVSSNKAGTARITVTLDDVTTYDEEDLSGQTFGVNLTVTDTAPTKYTVTFNTNGGSSVPSQEVTSGGKASEPSVPSKKGYEFKGWYKDSDLTQAYNFNTAVTGNLTLYAKWNPYSFKIRYYTNLKGKSEEYTDTEDEYAYNTRIPEPENPTKTGHIFKGWYLDSDLTNPYDFNKTLEENGATKISGLTATIGLYAKWESEAPTKTVKEIKIIDMPDVLKYEKGSKEIDLTGGKVLIEYTDGSKEERAMDPDDFDLISFDTKNVGDSNIILSYGGYQFNIPVTITAAGEPSPNTGIKSVPFAICTLLVIIGIIASVFIKKKSKFPNA